MTPRSRLWTVIDADGHICRRWLLSDDEGTAMGGLLFAAVCSENVLADRLVGPDGTVLLNRREVEALMRRRSA